jgi:Pyruvate/2-oxoacid:ferredoxin oxidoreductase delta subunit
VSDRASWRLGDPQLRAWLQQMLDDGHRVVAPVDEDGLLLHRALDEAAQAIITPSGKTRWSPKEYLFARSESLYCYRLKGSEVRLEDPVVPSEQQFLFGVRSCDAAGLARLDDVFLSGRSDPIYAHRRALTTVVSVACATADPECFCTAVGGSPVGDEGSDLQLLPLAEGWLLRVPSERGEAVVASAAEEWRPSSAEDDDWVEQMAQEVADQIERSPVHGEWSEVLEEGFEHPVWERLAELCLGCSVCAYLCPSCSCFDMNHQADAWCGQQCRTWDACTLALFTRHASGHNPRSSQADRYRQRVLHKFAFNAGEESSFRCVGCGRCTAHCPAGLDIADSVATAVTAIREESRDASG